MPRRPRPWTRTPEALALWQGWRDAVTTATVLALGLIWMGLHRLRACLRA